MISSFAFNDQLSVVKNVNMFCKVLENKMVASWTHATADKSEMIVLYKRKAKTFNQIWPVRFH